MAELAVIGVKLTTEGVKATEDGLQRVKREAVGVEQQLGKLTSAQRAQATNAQQAYTTQIQSARQFIAVVEETRRAQALAATATSSSAANAARAAFDVGRLRESLTSMATAATGVAVPGLAQLTGLLGTMVAGAPLMAGVMAGVTALGFAWKKMSEDAREAAERTQQSFERLEAIAKRRREGLTGALEGDLNEQRRERDRLFQQILDAMKPKLDLRLARFGTTAFLPVDEAAVDALRKQYADVAIVVRAGEDELSDIRTKAAQQEKEQAEREFREEQERFRREYEALERHHRELIRYNLQLANERLRGSGLVRVTRSQNLGATGGAGPLALPEDVYPIARPWPGRRQPTEDELLQRQALQMLGSAAAGYAGARGGPAGGFISGAAAGIMSGNPYAAAVGGLIGLASAIASAGDAAKQAAERIKDLRRSLESTLAGLRADISGNSTEAGIARINAERDALLGQSRAAYPPPPRAPRPRGEIFSIGIGDDGVERARRAAMAEAAQKEAEILALTVQRIAILLQEQALREKMAQEDYKIRQLAAEGKTQEAADMAFRIAQQREYDQAVKEFHSEATIAALKLAQAAEATARAASIAAQKAAEAARFWEEMTVRGLRARGMTNEAELLSMDLGQRREAEEWIRSGRTPAEINFGEWVHQLERSALVTEQAIRDVEKALAKQLAALDAQAAKIQDQIQLAEASVRLQEQEVEATKRVVDSLKRFADSLVLNPSLTILSPAQQLMEARRQFDVQVAAARGGDRNAAMLVPDAARSFLDASRGYNASGPGYVADFLRTQAAVAEITDKFGTQLTVEQQILAELQKHSQSLQDELNAIIAAKDAAIAAAQEQIDQLIKANEALGKLGPPVIHVYPPPPRDGTLFGPGVVPPPGPGVPGYVPPPSGYVVSGNATLDDVVAGLVIVAQTVTTAVNNSGAQTVRTIKQLVP